MEKTIDEYLEEIYHMKIDEVICVMGIDITCIYLNCKSYLFGDKFVGNWIGAREELEEIQKERNGNPGL